MYFLPTSESRFRAYEIMLQSAKRPNTTLSQLTQIYRPRHDLRPSR